MSQKADLVNVRNICESVAEELDYELVDVEFIKENSEYFLRIYIYTKRDNFGWLSNDEWSSRR